MTDERELQATCAALKRVYWLGGGSGAGKSTIVRRIAKERRFVVYSTDDVMRAHAQRLSPADAPELERFKAMSMDQRWLERSPETMLHTFHWFRGDGFDLITQDLMTLQSESPIIAEGFRLLPTLVNEVLEDKSHAVWLLPTPEFRARAFQNRAASDAIAERTSDPERALQNLLDRDRLFTVRLRDETTRIGLQTIDVDINISEDQLTRQVVSALQL